MASKSYSYDSSKELCSKQQQISIFFIEYK